LATPFNFTGITQLKDEAFDNTGLNGGLVLNDVTFVGSYTFAGCPLTSVTFGGLLTEIGSFAFSDCTSLTSIDWGGSQITSIGSACFKNCTSLTTINLPDSISDIGSNN